jgi:fatty-acyl-CoA synthase
MLKTHAAAPVHDVSTNWDDPVTLSDELMVARGKAANPAENNPLVPASAGAPWAGKRVAEVNAQTCPRAKAIMHGVDPDRVAQVLQANDVQVLGSQVFRVEGVYTGFWFGAKDDVVVRIRPERTDVRSIRREGVSDDGTNCKRVTRIVEALDRQPSIK